MLSKKSERARRGIVTIGTTGEDLGSRIVGVDKRTV